MIINMIYGGMQVHPPDIQTENEEVIEPTCLRPFK